MQMGSLNNTGVTDQIMHQQDSNKGGNGYGKPHQRKMSFLGRAIYQLGEDNKAHDSVITSIMYFKSVLKRQDVENILAKRLICHERFHSVIERKKNSYKWKWTDNIDMAYHLTDLTMEQQKTDKDIETFISESFNLLLDKSKPLWRCYILPTENCGSVFISRIHHSIGDGMTLVHVLFSLLDDVSAGKQKPRTAEKKEPKSIFSTLNQPKVFFRRLYIMVQGVCKGIYFIISPSDKKTTLKLDTCENMSSKKMVSIGKKVDLNILREIKDSVNGTINDVLVTLITGAISRYLIQNNETISENSKIRGMFPRNMRKGKMDLNKQFGNNFTMVPIDFPLYYKNREEMLNKCKQRCDDLKVSPYSNVIVGLNKIAMLIMSRNTYTSFTRGLFDKVTFLFTNVPGPTDAVTFAGHLMDDIKFFVPALLGCTFSILSYNNHISIGILVDSKYIPKPEILSQCLNEELQELQQMTEIMKRKNNSAV